jgi:DnaJ-class molecular chaperone
LISLLYHLHSRPGFTKTIPGEGMPHVDNFNKKGDLIVEFEIEFPKTLTPESKDFIKRALIPNAYKKEEVHKPKKQTVQAKSSDFED